MPENDDMQRFDALLHAMLTKPEPEVKQEPHPEPEEGDLREGDGD